MTHNYDLKVIDLQILIVNLLKAHISQTIWWIWFIFGMMIDTGSEFYSMISKLLWKSNIKPVLEGMRNLAVAYEKT